MMNSKLFLFLSFLLSFTSCIYAQVRTPPTNVTTGFVHFDNATRQVTWYYTATGLVVYDGDVIFGTTAEFDLALVNVTYTSGHGQQNATHRRRSELSVRDGVFERSDSVFPGSPKLWPNGLVQYRYFDSNAENALQNVLKSALDIWAHGACIGLQQQPTNGDPKGAPGVVTIQGNTGGYCTASIGYSPTTSLWMSLDTNGACGTPEVLHVMGHLLGLINEQKRPDAPLHDPFQCQNLIDYPFGFPPSVANTHCCTSTSCCGHACSFTIENGDYNIQDPNPGAGGPFDLDSIMLFPRAAFAKPGTFTLPNSPASLPALLSGGDIFRVRELYGCLGSTPPPPAQCPAGCNPAAGQNTCSFPTAPDCIFPSPSSPNPRGACACRAGYKATAPGIADMDTTKQWRLPADEGNFRVWVAQGVPCDTLCNDPFGSPPCKEVVELGSECLSN